MTFSVEKAASENNIKTNKYLQLLFNVNQLFHFDSIKFDWIVIELFD